MLPALGDYQGVSAELPTYWSELFVGGGDGSLLWWAQQMAAAGKPSTELPDIIDQIIELGEPLADGLMGTSSSSGCALNVDEAL